MYKPINTNKTEILINKISNEQNIKKIKEQNKIKKHENRTTLMLLNRLKIIIEDIDLSYKYSRRAPIQLYYVCTCWEYIRNIFTCFHPDNFYTRDDRVHDYINFINNTDPYIKIIIQDNSEYVSEVKMDINERNIKLNPEDVGKADKYMLISLLS